MNQFCEKHNNFNYKNLKPGLYKIFWKAGTPSLAAVGKFHDGGLWFAPTEWTCENGKIPGGCSEIEWDMIVYAEEIK